MNMAASQTIPIPTDQMSFLLRPYNALALSRERRLNNPAIHSDATAPLDGRSAC